jgi:hypothetical protein
MMCESKVKPIVSVIVEYEEFTDYEFIPPGSFYIRAASGDYIFLKTSNRAAAQEHINNEYGKGRYTVIPTKLEKTKSKLESGGLSCTGTNTRKGQKR